MKRFYPGLHQPADAKRFQRCCISINRLDARVKPLGCPEVLIDSGAFTEVSRHGEYRTRPAAYARRLRRLVGIAEIVAAVSQDYMCESFILERTGCNMAAHQLGTVKRYDQILRQRLPFHVMPVLQGYAPADYVRHLVISGERLTHGMWVGVGSLCKRNSRPEEILEVLTAIREVRPDLVLHGFGVKLTALMHGGVFDLLDTADSMAWSYAARKEGRNANDWREARHFASRVEAIPAQPWQMPLPLWRREGMQR